MSCFPFVPVESSLLRSFYNPSTYSMCSYFYLIISSYMSDNLTPGNVSHTIPHVLKYNTGARGMLRRGLPGVGTNTEGVRGSYRVL